MQSLEVTQASAGFAIEIDLLADQPDEQYADPDRPREAGDVPADAVTVGVDEEAEETDRPDERSEQEEPGEGIRRRGVHASRAADEGPHRGQPDDRPGRPEAERRPAPRRHDERRQHRPDPDDADHQQDGHEREPQAEQDACVIAQT